MHQRPSEPGDEDIFFPMGSPSPHQHNLYHEEMAATTATGDQDEDPLDDVWGSDSGAEADSPAFLDREQQQQNRHPSDMPRLRAEHATAGYREGITAAKAKSIQAGFDEGFGLGATLGLRAGHLLGLAEGIAAALRDQQQRGGESGAAAVAAAAGSGPEAERLLADARAELSTESIFGERYWAPDGTWKYHMPASSAKAAREGDHKEAGEQNGSDEVLFDDVAAAHPLIAKWTALLAKEVERWNLNTDVLAAEEPPSSKDTPAQRKEIQVEQQPRELLDW